MPCRISVTPKTTVFVGQTVFTNHEGEGIFTRRADGSHQQHAGTSQTPTFRSAAQLSAWLRRNYPDADQQYAADVRRSR